MLVGIRSLEEPEQEEDFNWDKSINAGKVRHTASGKGLEGILNFACFGVVFSSISTSWHLDFSSTRAGAGARAMPLGQRPAETGGDRRRGPSLPT